MDMPMAAAILAADQWVADCGGSLRVRSITLSVTVGGSGGMRAGRVLSRSSPLIPSCAKRACQRQTQVFDFPVLRMMSLVPKPSALCRMIWARQTCFCIALRLTISAVNRRRSVSVRTMAMPGRMMQTGTSRRGREFCDGTQLSELTRLAQRGNGIVELQSRCVASKPFVGLGFMKISVDIDCTPDEARSLLCLPDVKPLQEAMMAAVEPDALMKMWMPSGVYGLDQLQQAFWQHLMG